MVSLITTVPEHTEEIPANTFFLFQSRIPRPDTHDVNIYLQVDPKALPSTFLPSSTLRFGCQGCR